VLHLFLTRTVTGSTIIAMAQNRDGASLVGIDATRVAMLVFAISGVLAAVAATLYAHQPGVSRPWATWSSPRPS
jgi:branched-chain amino acid transport system permease protein